MFTVQTKPVKSRAVRLGSFRFRFDHVAELEPGDSRNVYRVSRYLESTDDYFCALYREGADGFDLVGIINGTPPAHIPASDFTIAQVAAILAD